MNKYTLSLVVCLLFSTCIFNTQAFSATDPSGTISVVSFDGLGHMDAQTYMNKGVMPNLQKFQQQSAHATDFVTVMPSLTAPSHAAMATGAVPAKTGIVSNHFHLLGEKIDDDESGFSQTLGVTPIWKEVQDYGKVTATVAFPGSNPANASAATYAVYSGGTLANSDLHNLTFTTIQEERAKQLSPRSGKIEEAIVSLDIKDLPSEQLFIRRVVRPEPKLYISQNEQELGQAFSQNDWMPIRLDAPSMDSAGFYVKLKGDPANKERLKLFQGTVMEGLYHGPGQFSEEMISKFGFYPAADELQAYQAGQITRGEYEEASERFTQWITDVSLYMKETYSPDLLFYYYPVVDTELHEFLLRDSDQPDYELDHALTNEWYISWAFSQVDQVIGQIQQAQNKNDHLLILSDHGLEPIHTRLSPNKELENAGLLVRDEDGQIDLSKTKAYAEVSGTIANVYVNLKGRETEGVVARSDYEETVQQIVTVFTNRRMLSPIYENKDDAQSSVLQWLTRKASSQTQAYTYPTLASVAKVNEKNVKPYETIWTSKNAAYATINNDNSGDVFLSAAEGYLMGKNDHVAVGQTKELGSHGGDPERPRLRPILFAAGPKIPNGVIRERITMTDIAPSVYDLLNVPSPDFVDGEPIWKQE